MSNRTAMLTAIAMCELGPEILAQSDNGYNVIVGSLPGKLILMDNYRTHPNRLIQVKQKSGAVIPSTAAGRYQLLYRWFVPYSRMLKLPDFGPQSQDVIALTQIKERGALPDIDAGHIPAAVEKIRNIWASLPGAGYGQREHGLDYVLKAYQDAGGVLA